jgi:hypothetical protein
LNAVLRLWLLLIAGASLCFSDAPTITFIANAAIPSLDTKPDLKHPVSLAPRSIATIFGTNLAGSTASTTPPWKQNLGGVEVHFAINPLNYPCWDDGCERAAGLLYVSPDQVNLVVPDGLWDALARIVLIRDGVRYDNHDDVFGGPGLVQLGGYWNEFVLFGVGYECLFSYSLTDPSSCGVSWSPGKQHREFLGAVTDSSGQLITSQNPVRQGEPITLWVTQMGECNGVPGGYCAMGYDMFQPPVNGHAFPFGVSQFGKDITATVERNPNVVGVVIGTWWVAVTWEGESPQFVGMGQINLNFPTCAAQGTAQTTASEEQRYDAWLTFGNLAALYADKDGNPYVPSPPIRVYLPFLIKPGDPACQW